MFYLFSIRRAGLYVSLFLIYLAQNIFQLRARRG
jgi:hypothetical protein